MDRTREVVISIAATTKDPLLYLSLYFKTHRQQYYDLLNHVRTDGDWESWLSLFADAVAETAEQAVVTARKLQELTQIDEISIDRIGRVSGSAIRVYKAFLSNLIMDASEAASKTGLTQMTVNKCQTNLSNQQYLKKLLAEKEIVCSVTVCKSRY